MTFGLLLSAAGGAGFLLTGRGLLLKVFCLEVLLLGVATELAVGLAELGLAPSPVLVAVAAIASAYLVYFCHASGHGAAASLAAAFCGALVGVQDLGHARASPPCGPRRLSRSPAPRGCRGP